MILRKLFTILLLISMFKLKKPETTESTNITETTATTLPENQPNTTGNITDVPSQNNTNTTISSNLTTPITTPPNKNLTSPKPPIVNDIIPHETACDFGKYSYYTQISGDTQAGRRLCGGAILTSSIVLTSAHCCNGFSTDSVTIYFGYNGNDYELKRKTTKIEMHPYFATLDPKRTDMTIYDACILTIDTPVDINQQFKAVEIGTLDTMKQLLYNSSMMVEIIGYGLKYTPSSKPHNENPVIFHCEKATIIPSKECGFSKPSCDGNFLFCTTSNHVYMGSPVIFKCKLVGLMSFEGNHIMYHSRIDTIRAWLEKKGLSGVGLKRIELRKNVLLFVMLLRSLVY